MKKKILLLSIGLILLLLTIWILYFRSEATHKWGYSDKIESVSDIKSYKLDDGSILVVRKYREFLRAKGLNAFPSGGISYDILNKIDLFRIDENGEILWQNVYVEQKEDGYQIDGSQIKNATLFKLSDHPEIDLMAKYFPTDSATYKCADSKYQILFYLSDFGIEIDNNKTSKLKKIDKTCDEDITEISRDVNKCDKLIAFIGNEPRRDNEYAYNAYCIAPLLEKITINPVK